MDYQTLRTGDQGQEVVLLQRLLNKAGNYSLAEDGIFGEKTYAAVRAFQESQGLSVDGTAGEATWAALAKKAEMSNVPATAGAINWQKIGLWSALALGAFMIYKRFSGYYNDEGDEYEQ